MNYIDKIDSIILISINHLFKIKILGFTKNHILDLSTHILFVYRKLFDMHLDLNLDCIYRRGPSLKCM